MLYPDMRIACSRYWIIKTCLARGKISDKKWLKSVRCPASHAHEHEHFQALTLLAMQRAVQGSVHVIASTDE